MIGTNTPSRERFPSIRPHARLTALLGAALAASCGSSGGGSSDSGPTILSAVFAGATSTPQQDDHVLLFLSEDVQISGSGVVSDADFALSGSATLGATSGAPTLVNSRTVSITLGAGVTFTPGTTTITWSADNDLVRDTSGNLGEPATPVVIGTNDGSAPVLSNVTVAAIDGELNGTGPAGGLLQVAPSGFLLDFTFSDNVGIARVAITADVPVSTSTGSLPAGTDLQPLLTIVTQTATTARYSVPSSMIFPQRDVILDCTAIDTAGLGSSARQFSLRVKTFSDALRPFETNSNSSQVWFLDFTRDQETFAASAITGGANVTVTLAANGRSDFEDLLRILGLNSATPIPNVSGSDDSNKVAQDLYKAALLAELATLYSSANVTFTLTQPSGTLSSPSVAYSSFGYSRISIAGAPTSDGTLGVAIFDPHNETQDDDTLFDYQGTRLGIFLYTMVRAGFLPPASSPFQMTFDAFAPVLGGTAIGEDASDDQRLLGTLNDTRATAIDTALADFARFTAVVLAHECGHSMGLVENGAMPAGLYGNDPTNFPGSVDGHIRNVSLFPSGATNVMSPALSYSATLHPSTAFNSLNMAYLREQVFYGN